MAVDMVDNGWTVTVINGFEFEKRIFSDIEAVMGFVGAKLAIKKIAIECENDPETITIKDGE
jgi:hypothetical protein